MTFRLGRALGVPLLLAVVATASAPGLITVHRGDTLSQLALDHHTTTARLRLLNHIPGNGDLIYAGQTLRVPSAAAAPAPVHEVRYRVVRGDTLSEIAHRFGVSNATIAARNHLSRSGTVYAGSILLVPQILRVPQRTHGGSARATPPARHYPAAVTRSAAAHRAILAARRLPSKAAIKALIARTARSQHVDPSIALAVAYQESGFQADVVSAADAIGPMQVLPATGAWMSQVVGRRLNMLKPADSVLAGVTLLRLLTSAAPVDQAVAGYYQGLSSVRQRGMFADTKQYVAAVRSLRPRFR